MPYGHRLLPVEIDRLAVNEPKKVYASIPKSLDLEDGFRDITYADLARAINRAAAWLEETFGRSKNCETLVYIGLSDLRYPIFIFGASKVGFQVCVIHDPNLRNLY